MILFSKRKVPLKISNCFVNAIGRFADGGTDFHLSAILCRVFLQIWKRLVKMNIMQFVRFVHESKVSCM